MITQRKLLMLIVGAVFSLAPLTIFAHHSTSEFDQTTLVEVEGEVVEKFWKNPHVMVHVATKENGKDIVWALEGNSVSSQRRRGLTSDMINVGDKVKVAGYVSTRRDNNMLVRHMLLPSGQELLLRGNAKPRWPEAELIAFKNGIDEDKVLAATADGLFRVWTWGRMERGWWFFGDNDKFPLTEAALVKHASWNEFEDNLQLDCLAPGMPNTMGNPYPIEFVKVGENIVMNAEEFDVSRTIHMNKEPDTDAPLSHLGHSVGKWEDENTLLVSTSKINYPYFNRVGVSQSEEVTVEERFTVDDEDGKLHYELTVTDAWSLTEPYNWKALWVYNPGEVVGVYGCEVEEPSEAY